MFLIIESFFVPVDMQSVRGSNGVVRVVSPGRFQGSPRRGKLDVPGRLFQGEKGFPVLGLNKSENCTVNVSLGHLKRRAKSRRCFYCSLA